MPLKIWQFLVALLFLSLAEWQPVSASTIVVPEREIMSFANAPEVIEFEIVSLSEGHRGVTTLLRFANDCYAAAGPRVLLGWPVGGLPHLFIIQRTDPQGCPDIFQPTTRRLAFALPPDVASPDLRLIAKPAPPSIVRVPSTADSILGEFTRMDVEPFAQSVMLPPYAVSTIETDQGDAGYILTGEVGLVDGCSPDYLKAWVLEVPNQAGQPIFDVIVLSAPEGCAGDGEGRADLSIQVKTPQDLDGRFVYIVNEVEPIPRRLD